VSRAVRQWLTARISERAVGCAPWLSETGVKRLERLIAWAGPRFPVIRRIVADNMRAVGAYTDTRHREYFSHAAQQLGGWLHAFRHAQVSADGPSQMPSSLARLVNQRFQLDESVDVLRDAASAGKGVILMSMHIADPAMWLARLNRVVPLTVLARPSKDPRRQRIKDQIPGVLGFQAIMEPSHDDQRGARLAKMADALRQGRTVLITPDLARKCGDGRPVRFFDREIYLPSGPAVLSATTGAPLMFMTARADSCTTRLVFHGPFVGQIAPRTPESKDAAITERMQWFAHHLEAFLLDQTPLWFLWGDKRWTRVFRGDPQYVRFPVRDEELTTTSKPAHGGA